MLYLSHPLLSSALSWAEGDFHFLTIEHRRAFREMIETLCAQAVGDRGSFLLSEEHNPLELSKYVEVITDPFSLDAALQKKLVTAVEKEAIDMAHHAYSNEFLDLFAKIQDILQSIRFHHSQDITFDQNFESGALLKLFHIRPDSEELSMVEKWIQFMEFSQRYQPKKLYIWINLAPLLSRGEWEAFLRTIRYRKWNLLFIDTFSPPCAVENHHIIDEDFCEL